MAETVLTVKLDCKEVGDAVIEAARKLCGNPVGGASVEFYQPNEQGIPGVVVVHFQFQPKRAL